MPRKVGGSGHLKYEGWTVLTTPYDDGGFSSGTMERPALKHLIADIKAGKTDIVVVYEVDRLTRALSDFAKLVEVFDRHGASFVSATQQFIPPRAWTVGARRQQGTRTQQPGK
jgi:DNA invertase Pin-like site-specific DNA recombinase